MSNYKIGDKVVVIDGGKSYSLYDEWASRVGLNKWVEGGSLADKDEGVVVAVAPWDVGSSTTLLAVEKDGNQYIIGAEGVEKYVEDTRSPAEKAGLVIGEKYVIIEDDKGIGTSFEIGDIVTFYSDDGSRCPEFSKDNGDTNYLAVTQVKLYVKPENTVIEFDKVLTEAQIAAIKTLVA